jgi:hypothetical protein
MRIVAKILTVLTAVTFIIGGACSYWGWREYQVGKDSTPAPVDVDLAKLEAGERITNNHVRIGSHIACYYCNVYSYEKKKYDTKEPGPNQTVTYSYYPIISVSALQELMEPLREQYGPDLEGMPDNATFPLPQKFVVLVKTKRFKTVGALGGLKSFKHEESIKGLVINKIDTPSYEEKKLIREEFPNLDFDKVLILEEKREPVSVTTAIWFMVGGGMVLVLAMIGAVVCVILFMSSRS